MSKILHCATLIEGHTDIYLDLSDQTTPLMKNLVNMLFTSNLLIFIEKIKFWLIFIIFIQRSQYLKVESNLWKYFKKPTVRIGDNFYSFRKSSISARFRFSKVQFPLGKNLPGKNSSILNFFWFNFFFIDLSDFLFVCFGRNGG